MRDKEKVWEKLVGATPAKIKAMGWTDVITAFRNWDGDFTDFKKQYLADWDTDERDSHPGK